MFLIKGIKSILITAVSLIVILALMHDSGLVKDTVDLGFSFFEAAKEKAENLDAKEAAKTFF